MTTTTETETHISTRANAGTALVWESSKLRVCAASNVLATQQVYSAPAWVARHGDQSTFWTEEWRRKEMLADIDWIAGNIHAADDIEEMLSQLHKAAGA